MITEATRRQFETSIAPRLRTLGRRLRLYALLDGLAVLFPALIVAMLVTLLLDRAFRLEWDMRLAQLISGVVVLGFIAWRWVWSPLRITMGDAELALLVERRYPQLESRLISAVEFARNGQIAAPAGRSIVLMDAAVREAERVAGELRFQDALAHRRARKQAGVVLGCIAVAGLISIGAWPTVSLWFQRNVLLSDAEWPQRNRLAVAGLKDGEILVARGDDVSLSADVVPGYEAPRQVFIEYYPVDRRGRKSGASERKQMPAVMAQTDTADRKAVTGFTHTFERIEDSLECRIWGGDTRTDRFIIRVVDRPRVEDVTISVIPPAYTRLEPPVQHLRAGQTVAEVLNGSRLQFHIRTNKRVVKARLVRETGGSQTTLDTVGPPSPDSPYSEAGRAFTAGDAPPATASYHFLLEDELGFGNISDRMPPLRLSVRLLTDKAPGVKMRVKGVGEMITAQAVLPIEMDFTDTYGLASAALVHELGRKDTQPVSEPVEGFEPGVKAFTREIDWPAVRYRLAEGDRLTLRAEAKDFDDVSGPNVGESSAVTLRVVSREELLAELNRREQEYRQDFERLIRAQEELYAELLSLSRPVARPNEPSRDRLRAFNLLARRQRDNAGRLNAIRTQFEQILSELQINQLSTPTVEARLGGGVIEPMGVISRTRMPNAADGLDALARGPNPEAMQAARDAQDKILEEMNRILANIRKWEGFQEAVALLREVLKMQGELNEEIERRIEAEIFGPEPAGTSPATGPSN